MVARRSSLLLSVALAAGCGSSADLQLPFDGSGADRSPADARLAASPDLSDPVSGDLASDADGPPPGWQTPPMGGARIEPWLAQGLYKQWHCEGAPHPPRPPSPHGTDRICSNDLASAAAGGGEYPVGAASVKELYDGGGRVFGYSVSRRISVGAGGQHWYWYERIGQGGVNEGTGIGVCTGCHSGAAKDFVFTQVR